MIMRPCECGTHKKRSCAMVYSTHLCAQGASRHVVSVCPGLLRGGVRRSVGEVARAHERRPALVQEEVVQQRDVIAV